MALDINGWIDGITATGVVVFGVIFGLFFYFKSKKTGAKLLSYLGLTVMLAGLMFLGVFSDFLVLLITNQNIENNGFVGILSYIWFAPVIISAMFIGSELLTPNRKWYIISIIVVISVLFEIIMLIDPLNSFNFIPEPPDPPSINLIDYNTNMFTIAGMLVGVLLLSTLVFLGFGFLYKGFQTTGIIRRNFFYLSAGSIGFCIFGLLEGLTVPGIMVIFVRIGYLASFWFMYLGLRTKG